LANELMAQGLTVFQFAQTWASYNDPTKSLERLLLDGKVVHDGNSLLRWQVSHCFLETDGHGNVKPATNSEHNKKDNLMALIMAFSQATQHATAYAKSVYEERGFDVVRL
jgi:phage terminase large subunit-like protein